MATGMAKGAKARGKRIAFGDGTTIKWDHYSEQIFRGNPNIARPGDEGASDLEWLPFYRGNRIYNTQAGDKWKWNYEFKAIPGELFFSHEEDKFAQHFGEGYIVVEPNVPDKTVAPNKQWSTHRYDKVTKQLVKNGYSVVQFYSVGTKHLIPGAIKIKTPTFRHAARLLKNARLYIGPEGGLHHAASAVGLQAVVLFGGFIPPAVTGYDFHTNLTGGADACGSLHPCNHCAEAMAAISVPDVMSAALEHLKVAA